MLSSPIQSTPPQFYGQATRSAPSSLPDEIVEGCAYSRTIEKALSRNIPLEHPAGLRPDTIINMFEGVDQELQDVIIEMPCDAHTDEVAQVIKYVVLGNFDAESPPAPPGSLAEHILKTCIATLENTVAATIQRLQAIGDVLGEFLTKLGRNEFEGDLGRWASNLTISGLRTGLVTALLTTSRQLIGFALEKNLLSNAAAPLTRHVMSAIALAIGPVLNMLGALRDECNGTANQQTRLARVATLTLSMAAVALVATAPQALPAFAAYGAQMAFYSFATDLVNLFLPITDNAKANLGGTNASGVLNGVLQFLAFTGMNYTAPYSGPGYVMSQGRESPPNESESFAHQLSVWAAENTDTALGANLSVDSRANEIVESLVPVVGQDFLRGAYNGVADVASQVIGGELMHALQSENTDKGFRIAPPTPRIPAMEQVANQFLSTNAARTSMSETIVAVVIAATRFFSTLPIAKENVDHIVNMLVAAVVFAGRFGTVYVNERAQPG